MTAMTIKCYLFASLAATLWLTGAAAQAAQTCNTHIPETNPSSIYEVHGNGTVTDTRTGLMWKQCLEGQTGADCSGSSPTSIRWAEALEHAESHSFAGYSDWRLPNSKELESLVEHRCVQPAINEGVFPNAPSSPVWSGSPSADFLRYVWVVNFLDGVVDEYYDRRSNSRIRLVRTGQFFTPLPTLSAVDLQGTPTVNSATVTGTSDQDATGYWLVVPQGSTAPTAAQVKDPDVNGYSVTPAAQGSAAMIADIATSFTATNLSAATAYDFYLVAEASGQLSTLAGPVPFTTANFEAIADLWIDATTPPADAFPGERVVFVIEVGNDGPQPATGAQLTWLPPASLSNAAWQCEATAPAICPQAQGSDQIDLSLSLPVDGSLLFTVDAELIFAAGGEILVEADIAPGQEHDPDLTNNQVQQSLPVTGIHRDSFE